MTFTPTELFIISSNYFNLPPSALKAGSSFLTAIDEFYLEDSSLPEYDLEGEVRTILTELAELDASIAEIESSSSGLLKAWSVFEEFSVDRADGDPTLLLRQRKSGLIKRLSQLLNYTLNINPHIAELRRS